MQRKWFMQGRLKFLCFFFVLSLLMYGIASISFAEVDNEHPYGNIYGMIIVNATKGYFVGYAGWGNTTLYSFNPSNGTVYGPVSGLEHINIPGMEMGGGVD